MKAYHDLRDTLAKGVLLQDQVSYDLIEKMRKKYKKHRDQLDIDRRFIDAN